MLWFVIGLVVLIVGVLLAVWVTQRHFSKVLNELDARVTGLATSEIEKLVREIKGLHLTGESLKAFTKWQREFQQLTEGEGTDVETLIYDAETANGQLRFGRVRTGITNVETKVDVLGGAYAKVKAALAQIQDDESDNRTQLARLRKTYQEVRKTILAKSFAYGDSVNALDERLEAAALQFEAVEKVSESGDHHAAHEQIQSLSEVVSALVDLMDGIPPLLTELIKEFPEQLAELQSAFSKMNADHYRFAELDVPAELNVIQVGISNSKTALAGLNLEAAKKQNTELITLIDKLYDAMEAEMAARVTVERDGDKITKFVAHAKRQNHLLLIELDHLNQSYVLTHDELQTAKELAAELSDLDVQDGRNVQAIADHAAVYSAIAAIHATADARLREIEQQQHDINQSVSGFKAGEHAANTALEDFARDMRIVRRELERLQLPGLPEKFKDHVAHVNHEISSIHDQLDQVKINLDDIGKQLIVLQSDMDDLKQSATEIIDAAGMTGQLLQAANRYREEHPELNAAAVSAKALYNQIRYREAADTIASALEQAVPGSYQRIEDAYLTGKEDAPF